jgi:hypothetical protein
VPSAGRRPARSGKGQALKVVKRALYVDMPLREVVEQERSLGALVEVEEATTAHPLLRPVSEQ